MSIAPQPSATLPDNPSRDLCTFERGSERVAGWWRSDGFLKCVTCANAGDYRAIAAGRPMLLTVREGEVFCETHGRARCPS